MKEYFPNVKASIDGLTEEEQRVALVRLSARYNNGKEHFDHAHPKGYSWLCLRCALDALDHFYSTRTA